ncbi:MAG TPA: histidine kinase dimerization/phospho-acceptor domain-containing protein, partial [Bryobacteraceae bacterium]|nr:histidine kinase dimerization/phospho-acceptor domain-containing protein [Bryobacteraceae bacterium]
MRELKAQFANALLVVLTVAAAVSAFINFQQNFHPQKRYVLPEDGVTWVDRKAPNGTSVVEAMIVEPNGPGDKQGIKPGDRVRKIQGVAIQQATDVIEVLFSVKPYLPAKYVVERRGIEFTPTIIVGEREQDYSLYYQYLIGLAYLGIGLFVYFRRGNAPKSLHFLVLCLVSFVFSTFHYTGKLNTFDKVIYWGNVAAGIFAPTIFLHFCLTFPDARGWLKRRGRLPLVYLPGLCLLAVTVGIAAGNLRVDMSPIELRWVLDRVLFGYLSFMYLLGAVVLNLEYMRTEDTILRQQMKWLRNGAVLGIVPFTAVYVLPYVLGYPPAPYMKWSVLFLPLIPLTWAYAIIRYRLMDVDVIFQQGYVYTLSTVAVLGVFYGLFFTIGRVDDLSPSAIVALILVSTFVFQPIRNWIQEQFDRYIFYKDRYDYRRTLVEFARELSSETDLDHMLNSVGERLIRTLSIRYVAVFLREDDRFRLHSWSGKPEHPHPDYLDLSFLAADPETPYYFFERTRLPIDVISREMPATVRHSIADLDLTYYIPCAARGRTMAYLGISRTDKGDFLSSDDLELLVTLSGYVAIAIENSRLYRSLQEKVDEYERLKEFSENIVESINVGIMAVDLHDRVESWNSQIEKLTGIPRHIAVGRSLRQLFPAEIADAFDEVKGQTGIHNIYKVAYKPLPSVAAYAVASAAENGGNSHTNGNGNGHSHAPALREATLNIAIAPLVSKEMQEIGRLIIFDDITDRSELERRLVQADKLSSIGLLAAGVAHEVNTPLAVISTYAQMLAKQVNGDDHKTKLLDKIAKSTFRASEIVNSLLNFSRTSPAEFGDVDLNRVLDETISLVRHQLDKAGVHTAFELQREPLTVKGNAGKLQQVFLNLVLNARDAMDG